MLLPALEEIPVAEAEAEAGRVTTTALVDAITSGVFDTSGVVSERRAEVVDADVDVDTISLDDVTTWLVDVTEVVVGAALVVVTEETEVKETITEVEVGCNTLLTALVNPGTTGVDGRTPWVEVVVVGSTTFVVGPKSPVDAVDSCDSMAWLILPKN